MTTRKFDVDAYLAGEATLPGTFTVGFRRDLHLAREIIRRRRDMHGSIRMNLAR